MNTVELPGHYTAQQIPMRDYLADPCPTPSLSAGACHTLLTRSLKHVWAAHPRLGGRVQDNSDAADIGSVAHDLLLGGEGRICVIDPADYRSKPTKDNPDGSVPNGWTNAAIRAARDEARENGLTPILAGAMGAARVMVETAREYLADSDLAGVLDEGEGESTLIWRDGPIWFRARPDWLNSTRGVMVHYKTTTASAAPEPFSRLAVNAGYDVSLAFYRRVAEGLGMHEWHHVILAQEQAAPYACSLISLDPAAWAIADEKVARAVALWSSALAADRWPAYGGRIAYITPTPWALAESEQRALEAQEPRA